LLFRAAATLGLLAFFGAPREARAQRWGVGVGGSLLRWSDYGAYGGCQDNSGTSPALDFSADRRVSGAPLALHGRLRYHPAVESAVPLCRETFVPPGAGTFEYFEWNDGNPLKQAFVATDLSLRLFHRIGWFVPLLDAGAGGIWHGATVLPYGLASGGLAIGPRSLRLVLSAEYQRLGLGLERIQEVWASEGTRRPLFVSRLDLGPVRAWKPAWLWSVRVESGPRF
jgi:hypothetical protein